MASASDNDGMVLELYKMAVEYADRFTSRRATTNSFFLTLNTALAAIVGIISSARRPPPHGNLPAFDGFGLVVTAVAGIVFALVWRALLSYCRRLSTAKWAVITELEKRLPVQLFADEWNHLQRPWRDAEAEQKRSNGAKVLQKLGLGVLRVKHREATIVEQVVPWVFIVIYVALGIRALG
jgi:hypothetical protein